MSRKGKDQNDISLIIGTLPKRLQNKIASSCSIPNASAEPRPITILSKSSRQAKTQENVVKMPVLEASGTENRQTPATSSRPITILSKSTGQAKPQANVVCENRPKELGLNLGLGGAVCIPGILRVTAPAASVAAPVGHSARRRGRHHHASKGKEQTPLSPLACVRLTTDHPEWFEQLLEMPHAKDIVQLYDQLMVLHQRNLILMNWKNFYGLHEELQVAFKHLLLDNLKFVCEHKVDAFFWKLLFYNVREYLMRQHTDLAHSHTLTLIEQALKFYRLLYDQLMAKYAASRCESGVKVVGQRLLICLGDLSRYRTNHLQTMDYLEAGRYYQRAQELVPGNGAPYNQLAIIAIYHHKRFEAVYYYMRSLLTSNAIQTAKESLLDLFDEIRRKYEETEMKQSPLHQAGSLKKSTKPMRKEVWIHPDGFRCLHRTDVKSKGKNKATLAEMNRYDEMPTDELMPRIVSLYLYLIGKLYTGTDVDTLYLQLRKLQIQLSAALKHNNLLTRSKLLKMVALNVFVVEHNKRKPARREMRYHSFNFANSFFGLMLRKANQLLGSLAAESKDLQSLTEEEYTPLNTYLQFVKVYVHWLGINVDLWEPVRTEEHSFIDCWSELQTLFEYLECCLQSKFPEESELKMRSIALDEDLVLSGFDPLGRENVSRECNQRGSERWQFLKRIRKIMQFQNLYLAHQEALQQPLDSSFTLEELNSAMKMALDEFDVTDASTSCPLEPRITDLDDEVRVCPAIDDDISQLCKLKKELEAKAKVKQLCNSKLEEILKFVDTKLYIEVRPRYLLPDTNCFIDSLEDIEKLSLEFKRYTLIIPLTVIKELDGLSKGVKLDAYRNSKQTQRIHHFDEVSSRAKKSLEFIKSAKNSVKCSTTKGSFVNASVFALVEEEYLSNDDKILATAVSVSKSTSTEQCRDGKCFIQTELVLITTDRNLRVKALTRNLAVSALDEFLQWAKDCREST